MKNNDMEEKIHINKMAQKQKKYMHEIRDKYPGLVDEKGFIETRHLKIKQS